MPLVMWYGTVVPDPVTQISTERRASFNRIGFRLWNRI